MSNNIYIPNHLAVIMDENGRWATNRGLKRSAGHLEGSKAFEKMINHAFNLGVKIISVYAFSTDNFKRSDEEVTYLMDLFIKYFKSKMNRIMDNGIRVVFSGRKTNLREDVIDAMDKITEQSARNDKGILNICLNYGAQEEIVDAAKRFAAAVLDGKEDMNALDKENFYKFLYADLPPIDLLIRTSGEQRISNFMLYQAAYAELYFTDVLFPDFTEEDLDAAIGSYRNRNRRFGKA